MAQNNSAPQSVRPSKQNTFFGGAAILAVGIMAVKLIGMFYRIPLVNIIGEQGTADFQNAYNIYAVLLTVSTAGLPVAVSKLVSEANALGRKNQVQRIFRLALALFLTLGVLSFLVMFFRADWLAELMHDTKAAAGVRALAPAVICVGCLSAFRGYSQGHSDMAPTAISQIIEALCKLAVGLGLAYWMVKQGASEDTAAAGAITGVTVGTIIALAYMVFRFMMIQARQENLSRDVPDAPGTILRDVLLIALPITLSSSMVGIVTVIDSSLVQGQLQKVLLENPDSWELYAGSIDFSPLRAALDSWKQLLPMGGAPSVEVLARQVEAAQAAQASGTALTALDSAAWDVHALLESMSRTLYGNYSGALNIYNLPTSLMAAITASVIPAVSAALARRERKRAAKVAGSALRITALLAFPMGVGLFVMGTPIIKLLYPRLNAAIAGPLLSELGIATLFVCMMLVCNSVLQAYGFINLPVAVMLLGGVLKIFNNYNLVVRPGVGIYGAPFGNVVCFGLCMALDLVIISRVIPDRPAFAPVFAKPAAASALMGLGAWAVYGLLSKLMMKLGKLCIIDEATKQALELSRTGNALAVLLAIGVAVVIYGILVIALRAISKDDLMLMPKGEKIAKILHLS